MKIENRQSIRPNPNGDWPTVYPTTYIDPTAQLIGNVHIADHVYVDPNAVLRADKADANGKVHPTKTAQKCKIQDVVIIHALAGTKVTIAQKTSITHGCIIHGP